MFCASTQQQLRNLIRTQYLEILYIYQVEFSLEVPRFSHHMISKDILLFTLLNSSYDLHYLILPETRSPKNIKKYYLLEFEKIYEVLPFKMKVHIWNSFIFSAQKLYYEYIYHIRHEKSSAKEMATTKKSFLDTLAQFSKYIEEQILTCLKCLSCWRN